MTATAAAPHAPPLAPPGSPGAQLRALRLAWGWSQQQVAQASHYSQATIAACELGRKPMPEPVARWLAAVPWPPRSGRYPPTVGGLRAYLREHDMRPLELAAFLGASESTVTRWLTGRYGLPSQVRAWLAAGAPPHWRWGPPGAESPRYRPHRRCAGRKTRTRSEFGRQRRCRSRLIVRWEREAKPRPWRRKPAAVACVEGA
jgi:transcriptional regulator with XRE-family HTH domain